MTDLATMKKSWSHFGRPFQFLSQWDCARGILFSASDGSADEAVEKTVELLAPEKTFHLGGQTLAEWRQETEILREREHQESLLEPTPKTICIVVLHLDEFSEDFHVTLKGLFERSRRPLACLASATDPDRIPGYLRSHFFQCHRSGAPKRSDSPTGKGKGNTKPERTRMVTELWDEDEVNAHLRLGWTLIKTLRTTGEDGSQRMKYVLAWQRVGRPSKPRRKKGP